MHDLAKLWEFGVWLHLRLVTCFVTWLNEETGQLCQAAQVGFADQHSQRHSDVSEIPA